MNADYSSDPVVQLAVNHTRLAHVRGAELAEAHRRVGILLARSVGAGIELDEVSIDHVAGLSSGVALRAARAPVVLAMMRSGLFLAEGIWSCIPGAALVPWNADHDELADVPLKDRPVILVDAVLNTGSSLLRALELVRSRNPRSISAVSLTAYEGGLNRTMELAPDVTFVTARVSQRSYVGTGKTDTGSRLFGTTDWSAES